MTPQTALALRDIEILYSPFRHRKIELATRVVMASIPRNFATDGIPTPEMARYYRRRAEHELGLIITEGTCIDDPASSADPDTPNFFGGKALRAWKNICRSVHATNCKIIPQLWHVGMLRPTDGSAPNPEELPIGPSGIDPFSLLQTAPPMSLNRIHEVVESFGRAAAHARRLGFDGVEIQGGHGYLIYQFLWALTNHRNDEYGGDITRRVRFAREIVQAVRKNVGKRFPILFRLTQWKIGHDDARLARTPDELAEIILPLSEAGVDIFDCSPPPHSGAEFPGSPLNIAGWIRKISGKPIIYSASGGQPDLPLDLLISMLRANQSDLIAMGRSLLADHAWASKIHLGQQQLITPFSPRHLGKLY